MAMVSEVDCRQAISTLLQTWMPWVLAELGRAHPDIAEHLVVPTSDQYRELHDIAELEKTAPNPPLVAIVCPQTEWTRTGDSLAAAWTVAINVMTRGWGHDSTVTVNDLYRRAVIDILHNHSDLDGFARDTMVDRSDYRPVALSSRFLLSGVVTATVFKSCVVQRHHPLVPPDPPDPVDVPTIATTNVQIEALE
mgnify:CR=1 FL=1